MNRYARPAALVALAMTAIACAAPTPAPVPRRPAAAVAPSAEKPAPKPTAAPSSGPSPVVGKPAVTSTTAPRPAPATATDTPAVGRPDDPRPSVVAVGDSILWLNENAYKALGWTTDFESGAGAYTKGNSGRRTQWAALQAAVKSLDPYGVLVFEENATAVDDAQWTGFVQDMVDLVPDTVRLVIVVPVMSPEVDASWSATTAARAQVLMDIVAANQPGARFVRWDQAVIADPSLVYDGQHPTSAGSEWLRNQILAAAR